MRSSGVRWLGTVASRSPRLADAGFVAFGLFGGWAAARNPFSSAPASWITALLAAALAIAVRRVLFAAASLPAAAVPERSRSDELMPGRRAFLALGAAAGIAAIGAATFGRALQRGRNVAGIGGALGALYSGYTWSSLGPLWTYVIASLAATAAAVIIAIRLQEERA